MDFYYHATYHDVLIVKADGGLNLKTADELITGLEGLITAGLTKIVVDCTDLTYVSSYGLGVLIRLHSKMAKRGGDVKICNVHGTIAHLLQLARLDKVFHLYPDVNRALLEFRPPG